MVKNLVAWNSTMLGERHRFLSMSDLEGLVDLDGRLVDRLRAGSIRAANFADWLRSSLLFHQGGHWLDATVLATDPSFFSRKRALMDTGYRPSGSARASYRFSSWCLAAPPGDQLHGITSQLMLDHLLSSSRHYFFHGLAMTKVFDEVNTVSQAYSGSVLGSDFHKTSGRIRDEGPKIDERVLTYLLIHHPLHKLNWKSSRVEDGPLAMAAKGSSKDLEAFLNIRM